MPEPTKEQIELYRKLKDIIEDEVFLRGVMAFAMNLESEQILIDAIDNGELTEEEDFYQLIELSYEDLQDTED